MLKCVEVPEHLKVRVENDKAVAEDVYVQTGGVSLRAGWEDLLDIHVDDGVAIRQPDGVVMNRVEASGTHCCGQMDGAARAEIRGVHSHELLLQNADIGLPDCVPAQIDFAKKLTDRFDVRIPRVTVLVSQHVAAGERASYRDCFRRGGI